ncbi:hypothetical protein AAMO2058_000309100 [Amorphochlora amoebiformis]
MGDSSGAATYLDDSETLSGEDEGEGDVDDDGDHKGDVDELASYEQNHNHGEEGEDSEERQLLDTGKEEEMDNVDEPLEPLDPLDQMPEEISPAAVSIRQISVLDNPAPLLSGLRFELTFECIQGGLEDDLRWTVTWVGPSEDKSTDQILEDVLVGPVEGGISRFILQTKPPDLTLIPESEIVGATVILITCSYKGNKFLQVGYYVNVCSTEEEAREISGNIINGTMDVEPIPTTPKDTLEDKGNKPLNVADLWRNILKNEPRITQIPILWDLPPEAIAGFQPNSTHLRTFFNRSVFGEGSDEGEAAVSRALEEMGEHIS